MNWELFILTSLAIASTTITISKTAIFKPLRNIIPTKWLRKLFNCPYCLSHWLSLLAIITLFHFYNPLNLLIKTMAMVTSSSIVAWFIYDYLNLLEKDND